MLTRSIAAAAILLVGGAVGCSGSSASGPAIQPGAASMSGLALNPATLGVFTAYITATDAQPIMAGFDPATIGETIAHRVPGEEAGVVRVRSVHHFSVRRPCETITGERACSAWGNPPVHLLD